jgi:hypothetical protein
MVRNAEATHEPVQQEPSLQGEQEHTEEQDADTVRIVPLSETHMRQWQTSGPLTNAVIPRRPSSSPLLSQEEQEPSPSSSERDSSILSPDEQDRDKPSSSPEPGSQQPLHSSFAPDSGVQTAALDEQAGRLEGLHQTPLDYDQPLQAVESDLVSSEEVQEFSLSTPFHSSEAGGAINRAPTVGEASEVSSPVSPGAPDEETQQRGSFFQRLKQLFWSLAGLQRSPEAPGTAGTGNRAEAGTRAEAGLHSSAETAHKEDQTRIPAGSVPTVQIPADPFASAKDANASFLKQIQRTLLGEQRHRISAAAIIETPLRVQLNQSYTIRIHIMGRDEVELPGGEVERDQSGSYKRGGLSSLVHGETVLIEVRSALPGRDTSGPYAYMVQQAIATMPARGYAAEVTMPLQPLSSGPSGRRDRLHIFFLDEMRRPLYEKPFVVEVLVSHLVQPGREGHSVLTIPL